MDLVSQNLLLTSGGKKDSTYVDDVFSTYLYTGTGANRTITNGIDLAGEGGMVWTKMRDNNLGQGIFDTERGTGQAIFSYQNAANYATTTDITSFNSNGFSLGTSGTWFTNRNTNTYASWTFRKAPGFFDVVTWSGNSTGGRQIAHNLGSVPGCIMIKNTNNTQNWQVYHRGISAGSAVFLDLNYAKQTGAQFFNNVEPTSTHFTLGTDCMNNCSGYDYIAYLFAGGASDEPGSARSVEFDGSGDYLSVGSSSDFTMGTGDFTIEGWVNPSHATENRGIFQISNTSGGLSSSSTGTLAMGHSSTTFQIYGKDSFSALQFSMARYVGVWFHFALVRSSGVLKAYINGEEKASTTDTTNYNGTYVAIGGFYNTSYLWKGDISNFRVVKGTAVYTSSFRPPTAGLTNITNTKLLCCNKNTVTGSTVTPATITSNGDPQSTTSTPFDDPEGFKFGEEGDQNIIKCGSYVGNGSVTEIDLGFEPQWIMFKNASASYNWYILDAMRGIVPGDDAILAPNTNDAEWNSSYIDVTPTGFKLQTSHALGNASGNTYIYMCLRRPDGYVGKPAEAGTDSFATDTGNSSSTIPAYDSGFPVDMAIRTNPNATSQKYILNRLLGNKELATNLTDAEGSGSDYVFDSNSGWATNENSNHQSWMFKRGNGFDVRTYKGNNTSGSVWAHNLNAVPEMIWIKNRGATADWAVGHKGLNGGTNPWNYRLNLNNSAAQSSANDYWGGSNTGIPPTSTHFFLGSSWTESNANNNNYIAMLFASVAGISKVGSYTGSSYDVTINLGFTPRFLMVKAYNTSSGNQRWTVFDSLRGMGVGSNDKRIYLDDSQAQQTGDYITSVSATGITMKTNYSYTNSNGYEYIYYAHA